MEPDQKIKNQMLSVSAISILAVVILVAGIVFLAKGRSVPQPTNTNNPSTNSVNTTSQPRQETPTGALGMTIKGGKRSFSKGEKITFFVYADSYGKEVEAYDVVLRYAQDKLKLDDVSSSIDGIDIYDTEEQVSQTHSEVIITGVKGLSNKTQYVFNKTALIEVMFTALSSGESDTTLVYEKGSKRDSNLIDTANVDILNTVTSESVKIN
ncbi:hypothetical protein A3D06_01000 [Candidatus Roizmanbacteria bacterium RIFCSPHIGHO2_02_FULL_40_9]|uniref:Cohesin domain-containing protein n=1 Tax=Candidatus Roizmanbacteria bacterium RIFCSPHIGHO2_02_FULL_40_9 TaxID=1802042 RepID=A0A1F7HCZ4_9BACT|nr:MAG: hypothetical protein A3D06_01000 [Candidatus Roizmanbacteria bacterium RIFCSPHIGHO2_02_FULL_40_9]